MLSSLDCVWRKSLQIVSGSNLKVDEFDANFSNPFDVYIILTFLISRPVISGFFGATIFTLIRLVVHVRKDPVKWAVFTSPFFFLVAGTICTLSIVYKGSPNLGLDKKPIWFIVSVTLGVGFGLFFLSALFFVPYVHCKVIKKDYTLKLSDLWKGPALFMRVPPADAAEARVPNYNVIQHGGEDEDDEGGLAPPSKLQAQDNTIEKNASGSDIDSPEEIKESKEIAPAQPKTLRQLEDAAAHDNPQAHYRLIMQRAEAKHHAHLRQKRGPIGWVSHFGASHSVLANQ